MKKQYTKPAFNAIDIQLNDLCIGSKSATINLHVIKMNERKKFVKSYKEGETDDFWQKSF